MKNPLAEALAWIVVPTIIVAGLVVAAMNWPAKVAIEADIIATRMSFHAASGAQKLLGATQVRSLSLSRFDEVRIPIASGEIADPRKRNTTDFSWPPGAWRDAKLNGELILHPIADREARILITPIGTSRQPLALNSLATVSAEATLESPEKDVLALDVAGANEQGSAQLPQWVELTVEDCDCAGTPLRDCAGSLALRLKPPSDDTILSFSSRSRGIYAQVRFAPGGLNIVPDRDFAISRPGFRDLDETGRPVSTISGAGKIRFSDYPNTPEVALSAGDFLDFDPSMNLYIRGISAADDRKNLRIRMGGMTNRLESGERGDVRDRIPTWFDLLWKNSRLVALLTVITWLVPVLVGSRKLLREWSGEKS